MMDMIKTKSTKSKIIYKKIVQIKKSLIEEPDLREEFTSRMKDIDLEKAITIEDFGKRYGLK